MPGLSDYLQHLSRLRLGPELPGRAPHKPCLLLAVLDLVEFGTVEDGRVEYVQVLETGFFPTYFSMALGIRPGAEDWDYRYRPYYPFWYLKNDEPGFWSLHPRPGREAEFNRMLPANKVPTDRKIRLNVDCAKLEPGLFALMMDDRSRAQIRRTILEAYFAGTNLEELGRTTHREKIRHYIKTSRVLRDPEFPRAIRRIYDGTCAATGERIHIPDGRANSEIHLLDAAHLKPFWQTFDNSLQNGIALQPTYHRAMDNHLIAPTTDGKWKVSSVLLNRAPESRLCRLDGKEIRLPDDAAMHPREDCLTYLMERLLRRSDEIDIADEE